ncbi:MAG: SH3 domain-containing protein [Clostridia bacterium]|nr:SH3 domain-containing protein [Clostridia bacterium]
MKKFLLLFLAALCLTPLGCRAEKENGLIPYQAVIANPLVADRLNVREQPNAASASLGRFYSGTPVTVLDETTDGDGTVWARVQVHGGQWSNASVLVEGYAMKQYLMRKNRNYGAPGLLVTAMPVDSRVVLRETPSGQGGQVAVISGRVNVLGDVGDDWRYVQRIGSDLHGYVRTAQLTDRVTEIPDAFVIPADGGDRVTLYQDKELTREAGVLYAGVPVRVTDYTRAGWAWVESYGDLNDHYERHSANKMAGYVHQEDLTVFVQPWQVTEKMKDAYALRELSLADGAIVPQGAALTVLGETQDRYWALYGSMMDFGVAGMVEKSSVQLTGRYAGIHGGGRMGYADLPIGVDEEGYAEAFPIYTVPGDQEHSTWNRLAQLVRPVDGGMLQLRQRGEGNFFAPAEGVRLILEEDLWHDADREIAVGENRIAGEDDAGLWLLTVEPGKEAALTLTKTETALPEVYHAAAGDQPVYYTVYIPAGTQVTLTGEGVLTAARQGSLPVLLNPDDPGDPMEDEALFSGSGRFFCDAQLPDEHNYFDYRLEPMPGAEEDAWAKVTSLFSDGEDAALDEAALIDPEMMVEINAGEFLELHNCVLYVNYGNG